MLLIALQLKNLANITYQTLVNSIIVDRCIIMQLQKLLRLFYPDAVTDDFDSKYC